MKLFYCPKCKDKVSILVQEMRYCQCGGSAGMYLDEEKATFDGLAIPFGIGNYSFEAARLGYTFTFEGFFYNNQAVGRENVERVVPLDAKVFDMCPQCKHETYYIPDKPNIEMCFHCSYFYVFKDDEEIEEDSDG